MIFLLASCTFSGVNLEKVQAATRNKDITMLVSYLEQGEYSYIRERAAEGMRQVPAYQGKAVAVPALRQCVRNSQEKGYVRAQCALTLGGWGIDAATDDIISSLAEVDEESRYWIAVALRGLSTPQARAQLQELANDADVYLATSVRQWLETSR